MKSVKLQLLVTLAAVAAAVLVAGKKGLPPREVYWRAVSSGDVRRVERFAAWGADVTCEDRRLRAGAWTLAGSALHVAAEEGHLDLAVWLLDQGADPNMSCQDVLSSYGGYTPVYLAARNGHLEMVRLLLDPGASIEGDRYYTPLQAAVEQGHEDIARLLIRRGANVNADSIKGPCTALVTASGKPNLAMAQLLLDVGADVNTKSTYRGTTALHAAAVSGSKDMVLLLLDHGASNAVKDADGRTPADVAQAVNHQEVADLIRRYRAKE